MTIQNFSKDGIIAITSSSSSPLKKAINSVLDHLVQYVDSKQSHDQQVGTILLIDDTNSIPFEYLAEKINALEMSDDKSQFLLEKIRYSQCFDINGVLQTIKELTPQVDLKNTYKFDFVIIVNLKEMFNTSGLESIHTARKLFNDLLLTLRRSVYQVDPIIPDSHGQRYVYLLDRSTGSEEEWLLDYYIDQRIRT